MRREGAGCSGWDFLAVLHSDGRKVDTQNYSEVLRSILWGGMGKAAKWAKDREIKSGSLW